MSKIIKPLLPLALIGGFNLSNRKSNLRRPKNHLRSEAKDKVNPNSPVSSNFTKMSGNVPKCHKM
jgi:hypothetical protein